MLAGWQPAFKCSVMCVLVLVLVLTDGKPWSLSLRECRQTCGVFADSGACWTGSVTAVQDACWRTAVLLPSSTLQANASTVLSC